MNKNRNSVKINPDWKYAHHDFLTLASRVNLRSQYLWMCVNPFCNPPKEVKQLIFKNLYWRKLKPEEALPILRELDENIAQYEMRDHELTKDKIRITQKYGDIFVPPDMRPGCKSDYALNSVITWLNEEVKSHSNDPNNWNYELKNLISGIVNKGEEEKDKLNEEWKNEWEMSKIKIQEKIIKEEEDFENEFAELQIDISKINESRKMFLRDLEKKYKEETDPNKKEKFESMIKKLRKYQEVIDDIKELRGELEERGRSDQPADKNLGEPPTMFIESIIDILAKQSIDFITRQSKRAKNLFCMIKFRTWYLSAASRIISFIEFIIDALVISYVIGSIIKLFLIPIFDVPSPQTPLDIFNIRGVVLALGISLLKKYILGPEIKKKISQARWNLFDGSRWEAFTAALEMMYIRASLRAQKKQAEGIQFGAEEIFV